MQEQRAQQSNLKQIVKRCLDLLRQNAYTGMDAFQILQQAVCLKYVQHMNLTDLPKNEYTKYAENFTELINIENSNLEATLKYYYIQVLLKHSILTKIFENKVLFKLSDNYEDLQTLLKEVNGIQFQDNDTTQPNNTNLNILSEIYEQVLSDNISDARGLGQYYTPMEETNYILNLLKPTPKDTFMDMALGAGIFAREYYRYIKTHFPETTNKQLNDQMFGVEIEQKAFQMAYVNMLFYSGLEPNFVQNDSVRKHNFPRKYSKIMLNPPYGLNFDYSKLSDEKKRTIFPHDFGKSKNSVIVFVYLTIALLETNGEACILIPYGKEVCSNNSNMINRMRQYLFEQCEVLGLHILDKEIFNNTGLSTCIVHFKKKATTELQTEPVKIFRNRNVYTQLTVEQLQQNQFVLNPELYVEHQQLQQNEYLLGDLITLKIGKRLIKKEFKNGQIPVIAGGKFITGFHNNYNVNFETITIAQFGSCGFTMYHNSPIYCSDACVYTTEYKSEICDLKYLYFLLKYKYQEDFKRIQTGTAQPLINIKDINQFKINLPPIDQQKAFGELVVKYEKSFQEKDIETYLETSIQFESVLEVVDQTVYDLGEIITLKKGQQLDKKTIQNGIFPVFGNGKNQVGTHNQYNVDFETIRICNIYQNPHIVSYHFEQIYITQAFYLTELNQKLCDLKYLYFLLKYKYQEEFKRIQNGSAQSSIIIKDIYKFKIQFPPIEVQQKLVEKWDQLEKTLNIFKQTQKLTMN